MQDEPYTVEDFESKIDWEGGIWGALDYGLKPEEAPQGEVRELWTALCGLHAQAQPLISRLEKLLDEGRSLEGLENLS